MRKSVRLPNVSLLVGVILSAVCLPAYSAPQGGNVAAGSATITNKPGLTEINQSSNNAVINWQTFNIGSSEHTKFNVPNSNSATLNRINANNGASQILGRLSSNGQLYLLNPAGIMFGQNAQVNVGGLFATTADITNQDFMAGRMNFFQVPGYDQSSIINYGNITAAEGGLVGLVAPGVANHGVITARLGKVALGSGEQFTLDLYGDELIQFAVETNYDKAPLDDKGEPMKAAVRNSGTINADGGTVHLTARAASHVVDNVINMDGVIQANTVSQRGGKIILSAGRSKAAPRKALGRVKVSGKIKARGNEKGQKGGVVNVLGNETWLADNAEIDVSGNVGGGEIYVGGNFQGKTTAENNRKGPDYNGDYTVVESDAKLLANALENGDGGDIIVWSDINTFFYGALEAMGGPEGGNGGFAEVSGKEYLDFRGAVDLTALMGDVGTILLDPADLTICTAGLAGCTQQAIDIVPGPPIAVAAISEGATLSNETLLGLLSEANVDVVTQTGVGGNGAIFWSGTFNPSGIGITNTLTLITGGGGINFESSTYINAPQMPLVLDMGVSPNSAINLGGTISVASLTMELVTGNTINQQAGAGTSLTAGTVTVTTNDTNTIVNLNGESNFISNFSTSGPAALGTINLVTEFPLNLGNVSTATSFSVDTSGQALGQTAGTVVNTGNGAMIISTQGANVTLGNDNLIGGNLTLNEVGNFSLKTNSANALNLMASQILGNASFDVNQNITQSGVLSVGGTTLFSVGTGPGASNDVLLTNTGNTFTGTITATQVDDLSLGSSSNIDLGASTIDGNLTVTMSSNGNITDSGALDVTGLTTLAAGSSGNITLDTPTNTLTGNVTITSANNTTLVSDTAMEFDTSTISGNLVATATGNITEGNTLTVSGTSDFTATGGNVTLGTAGNSFAGAVSASGNSITLTNGTDLVLDTISVAAGNTLAVSAAGNITSAASPGGITTPAGVHTITSTGAAGSSINLSNQFTAPGTTTFTVPTTGSIHLTNANNSFGTVNFACSGGGCTIADITFFDDSPYVLAALTNTGSLTVSAPSISQAGAVTITNDLDLTARTGNIVLTTAGNNISGTVALSAPSGNVSLTNDTGNAVTLGAVTAGGTLDIISGANITGTSAISSTGNATFTAPDAADITLSNTSNNFGGTVGFASAGTLANVNIADSTALDFAALTVGTSLTANAPGITDSGAIVAPTATFTATSGTDVILNTATNNFGTINIAAARDASITDANAIVLGALNVTRNLTVNTTGAITDSGNIVVGGTSSFMPGAANDLVLNSAGNDFGGAVSATASTVTLVDVSAIDLGTITAGASVSVTSGGDITQSGPLDMNGLTSTFTAPNGSSIYLTNAGNDFDGPVSFVASSGNLKDVTIVDTTGVFDVAALNITGNLVVTAAGITDSGNIDVDGTTTLSAGVGGNITLDAAGSDFTGNIIIPAANNVDITGINGIALGDATVAGTFDITATSGSITAPGALTVTGVSNFTVANGNDILLTNINNSLGVMNFLASSGMIRNLTFADDTPVVLTDFAISGDLGILAPGITQAAPIDISRNLSLTATFNNDIVLTTATNDFGGTVTIGGGRNVSLVDNNGITMGMVDVSNQLNLTANAGDITFTDDVMNITDMNVTATTGNIVFNDVITNVTDMTLSAPLGNMTFAENVGTAGNRLRDVVIPNVVDFTLSKTLFANTFTQTGTGTSNFGSSSLNATGNVFVNTGTISGHIVGGNTTLVVQTNNTADVVVSNLTLGGPGGGRLTGSVAGASGANASYKVDLSLSYGNLGLYFMNNCPLPGGCGLIADAITAAEPISTYTEEIKLCTTESTRVDGSNCVDIETQDQDDFELTAVQ